MHRKRAGELRRRDAAPAIDLLQALKRTAASFSSRQVSGRYAAPVRGTPGEDLGVPYVGVVRASRQGLRWHRRWAPGPLAEPEQPDLHPPGGDQHASRGTGPTGPHPAARAPAHQPGRTARRAPRGSTPSRGSTAKHHASPLASGGLTPTAPLDPPDRTGHPHRHTGHLTHRHAKRGHPPNQEQQPPAGDDPEQLADVDRGQPTDGVPTGQSPASKNPTARVPR
jgi:hypothetical protein